MAFQDAQAAPNPIKTIGPRLEEVILEPSDVALYNTRRRVREMLFEVRMPDPRRVIGQYPFGISGGMCQRVMLAISLVMRPESLIAGEPTPVLDLTPHAELPQKHRDLVNEQNSRPFFLSHNDRGAMPSMVERVGMICVGSVVERAVVPSFPTPIHLVLITIVALPEGPGLRIMPLSGRPPGMIEFLIGALVCPDASRLRTNAELN